MAHELIFQHPSSKFPDNELIVKTKPDQVTWSYGLNTANYPTYGGEVVQILSCYIEDLTITGASRNYKELERIYSYFIDYIQIATQGRKGHGSFDPRPMTMYYPERNWTFKIHPKAVPAFRYGRDVVVPQWTMTAAVADPDQDLVAKIMTKSQLDATRSNGQISLFGKVTGEIGFEAADPFRTPFVDGKTNNTDVAKAKALKGLGDSFNNLIPAWLKGDFGDISQEYSRPAIGQIETTVNPSPNPGNSPPGNNGPKGN